MKNLILCCLIMLMSIGASGQISLILCDFEERLTSQSNNPLAFQVSDANPNGSTVNAQFVYDDFEVDEETGVDAICLVGRFGNVAPEGRENIGTRDAGCTPSSLTLGYFEDNGSDEPGDLIMSFDVTPTIGDPYPVGNFNVCSITLEHATVNLPVGKYWFSVYSSQTDFCDLELVYDDGSLTVRENDNTRAITPGFLVQDFSGARSTVGSGSGVNFTLRAAPLAAIPTMGQWGIMVLSLCFLIIGRLYIREANIFLVS